MTRRTPRQARSLDTIETIFEATARIIDRDGIDGLNTNRIAERAGIAIGTLYGYFPNKQSILIAMAQRELEDAKTAIIEALTDAGRDGQFLRTAIRIMLRGFKGSTRVRRALLAAMINAGKFDEIAEPAKAVADLLRDRAGRESPGLSPSISETQMFVLTRTLVGAIRVAALEHSPMLTSPELEDELVRIALCYIEALN